MSAVKLWAAVLSNIIIDFTCWKVWVLSASSPFAAIIVISSPAAFSTILSLSVESETLNVSPLENLPEVFITTNCTPVVVALISLLLTTNPVAPDWTPVIFAPCVKLAVSVGLGVSLKVMYVNILISKRYALYCPLTSPIESVAPVGSNARIRHWPIAGEVPAPAPPTSFVGREPLVDVGSG